jgi:spore coat protein U-like protein
MNRGLANMCLTLWLAWMPQSAWALLDSCNVSASGVSFGTYPPFSPSPTDNTGTVTVTCFGLLGGPYNIYLNKGLYSASFSPRQMQRTSGGNRLNYDLYLNSNHSTVWGDGSGSTGYQSFNCILLCLNSPRTYTVYGRIPASQTTVVPGNYSDTITVTVSF